MAAPFWNAATQPGDTQADAEIAAGPVETISLNLPENSDSTQQREVLDALPVLVFLEKAGKVVFANAEARETLGISAGEWVERPVEDVLWGLFPGTAEPQTHLVGTHAGSPFHATLPSRGGKLMPVEGTYSILNAELREAIIVAHPCAPVRAPKSRLMEDVLASIPEAVAIVHSNHVLYINPAFTQMFGYTAEEASGGNLRELIVPETLHHELAMLEKEVDEKGRVITDTVRKTKDGELLNVALVAAPLQVDGASVGYVLSFRDICDRKQTQDKLQHDALFDVLTGLANRALFLDRLTLALKRRTRRLDQNCGVLLVDMDRFKEINDEIGAVAADGLLLAVAERLREALRPEDSVSRIGGDEFAVLLENIMDKEDMEVVAARINEQMSRPFEVFGSHLRAGVSMGMAVAGAEHLTSEMLLRDAELALSQARHSGGGSSEVFNKQKDSEYKKGAHHPERALRTVLQKRQYEVWYQPIYQLNSGELEGFESLLRLRRPDGSVGSFLDHLGVAEDTGLSITLGRETMDTVCRQLHSWANGVSERELILTLNLSERQFFHPAMVGQLKKALLSNAVDPTRLVFEVAESTLNQNPEAAAKILQSMAECKVRIALDNFGSRLAPLNHLARLPIDLLKISPKLTAMATAECRQAAVLHSLIQLGKALGMQVVAQGMETQEQLEAVTRMGCELGQGHLFAYALEPARASKLAGLGRWGLAAGA